MMFPYYYGFMKISDGKQSVEDRFSKITCHHGKIRTIIKTSNSGRAISEIKVLRGNRILEWEKYGAFYRGYKTFCFKNITAPVIMRYHPDSIHTLHGLCERYDQKLFGLPGKVRTQYNRGRLQWQDFRYKNGRIAYRMRASDKHVIIKHPNGRTASVISCPDKGFSVRSGNTSAGDTHTCQLSEIYFNGAAAGSHGGFWRPNFTNTERKHDYSRDGNCLFNFWTKHGRLYGQGEYKDRQKIGEWVVGGKHVYFINGIAVAKKLWDTPPAKLKVKTVLKLKNAQMRAALIARIGAERFSRECKSKTINETKNGMKLMEFPVPVDDGNGDRKGSRLRILQVTCPSTKHKYYLNVPDFIWNGGNRTKLDTCEQARQWTFGVDNPKNRIQFAVEA